MRQALPRCLNIGVVVLVAVSCGTVRSVSAIRDADKVREESLEQLAATFQDSRIVMKDTYGRKYLSREAANFVEKEHREPLYLFYVADGLLAKARDLQAKSEHERACDLAEKSQEMFQKTLATLRTIPPAKDAGAFVPASPSQEISPPFPASPDQPTPSSSLPAPPCLLYTSPSPRDS